MCRLQEELAAANFTQESKIGRQLMSKCRSLADENEEMGRELSEGKVSGCWCWIYVFSPGVILHGGCKAQQSQWMSACDKRNGIPQNVELECSIST